jgi:YggT family protein
MLIQLVQALFLIYTLLLFLRVFGSWVPQLSEKRWMRLVGCYTDPYLNLFRRLIPPLGVIDISAILAFFVLQMSQHLVLFLIKTMVK